MTEEKASRAEKIKLALSSLGLEKEHFHAVTEVNPSANAPYHNASHCFMVALNCLDGANYYRMSLSEKRSLFLAGLYHDYDHSMGEYTDDINIVRAIAGMSSWCRKLEDFTDEQIRFTASIIEGTVWPAKLFEGVRDKYQEIICDADHMQWLEPDADVFLAGLTKETGLHYSMASTEDFLKEIGVKTLWGFERMKQFQCGLRIPYKVSS